VNRCPRLSDSPTTALALVIAYATLCWERRDDWWFAQVALVVEGDDTLVVHRFAVELLRPRDP
jgi:hypothetical protein